MPEKTISQIQEIFIFCKLSVTSVILDLNLYFGEDHFRYL